MWSFIRNIKEKESEVNQSSWYFCQERQGIFQSLPTAGPIKSYTGQSTDPSWCCPRLPLCKEIQLLTPQRREHPCIHCAIQKTQGLLAEKHFLGCRMIMYVAAWAFEEFDQYPTDSASSWLKATNLLDSFAGIVFENSKIKSTWSYTTCRPGQKYNGCNYNSNAQCHKNLPLMLHTL